ncbi:MAG: MFS transporter [Bacteroidales bacterium]|nr:MFS transporter [Bacteroidales bacterium]
MSIFKKFPRIFWVANSIELFERYAWYGLFNVLAIYLTASTDTGALGFSQEQKGMLMGIISAMVYFLPVFTGAIADKIGYKVSLLIAFVLYFSGYLLMGQMNTYAAVFVAFGIVGLGAAMFKPIISATISKSTTKETSSLGFGIFYMMVNFGALIGPFVSSKLRESNWNLVFFSSAAAIIVNFILAFFLFKEPEKEKNNDSLKETFIKIANNIFTVFKDWKFLIFLLLIVGFWTMYMQLFFTLPVFIEQWIDTSVLYDSLSSVWPWLASKIGTPEGTIAPEMILNVDALYIVFFQLIISTVVMKWKALNAMISGIFVASFGIGLTFMFNNPFFIFMAILVFAIGEMASSPKITEYIGLIAPKDRKALYMGMSFLPVAGGNFLGGFLSGNVYGKMSDKVTLLENEFTKNRWDIPEITKTFTQNDFYTLGAKKLNIDPTHLSDYLWAAYNPQNIWYVFTAIGLTTVIGLILYDKFILKSKKN